MTHRIDRAGDHVFLRRIARNLEKCDLLPPTGRSAGGGPTAEILALPSLSLGFPAKNPAPLYDKRRLAVHFSESSRPRRRHVPTAA
jgi:hypothetical protein